jgi:hypothetical protein
MNASFVCAESDCGCWSFASGDMKDAAGSYIREIAVQPGVAHNVVIGGFDHKLNFLDLNRPDNPYVQRLDMQAVIGSVKWAPFNASQLTHSDAAQFYSNASELTSCFALFCLCL